MAANNIMSEEWDYLIVLDACRYDVFKKVYREFLNSGVLEKRISPATHTIEWLIKSFPDFYPEVVYISSNPLVNSIKPITRTAYDWYLNEDYHFDASKHFDKQKIIDVWLTGWSDEFSTVLPGTMVNEIKKVDCSRDRIIAHFNQPHQPYISIKMGEVEPYRKISSFRKQLKRFIPYPVRFAIRMILNTKIQNSLERAYRTGGWEKIRQIYTNEVRIVLHYVSQLIESTPGVFLITADHGERLGESLFLDPHGPSRRTKEIIEVPFFLVESE